MSEYDKLLLRLQKKIKALTENSIFRDHLKRDLIESSAAIRNLEAQLAAEKEARQKNLSALTAERNKNGRIASGYEEQEGMVLVPIAELEVAQRKISEVRCALANRVRSERAFEKFEYMAEAAAEIISAMLAAMKEAEK